LKGGKLGGFRNHFFGGIGICVYLEKGRNFGGLQKGVGAFLSFNFLKKGGVGIWKNFPSPKKRELVQLGYFPRGLGERKPQNFGGNWGFGGPFRKGFPNKNSFPCGWVWNWGVWGELSTTTKIFFCFGGPRGGPKERKGGDLIFPRWGSHTFGLCFGKTSPLPQEFWGAHNLAPQGF